MRIVSTVSVMTGVVSHRHSKDVEKARRCNDAMVWRPKSAECANLREYIRSHSSISIPFDRSTRPLSSLSSPLNLSAHQYGPPDPQHSVTGDPRLHASRPGTAPGPASARRECGLPLSDVSVAATGRPDAARRPDAADDSLAA